MITREQTETILKPHLPDFETCFRGGMDDYSTHYDDTRPVHSPRTRSSILRDHIVDHARRVFGDREAEGVRLRDLSNGFFGIEIDGKSVGIDDGCILVRIKKLDKRKLTRNVPTKQATDFCEQKPLIALQVQPKLDGVSWERSHLNAGYIINPIGTNYDGLFVTFPNGQYSIDWYVDMMTGEASDTGTVVDIQPQEPSGEATKRVRHKGSKEQEKEVKENESGG